MNYYLHYLYKKAAYSYVCGFNAINQLSCYHVNDERSLFTNKNIGSSRAEISNDLSIDLALPLNEDSNLFKKMVVDKKIIDKHSYLTLANLDSKFNSINNFICNIIQ